MYNPEKDIIITVDGGVIQDITFPPGCKTRVIVRDYDVEGMEDERIDEDTEFIESKYDPKN